MRQRVGREGYLECEALPCNLPMLGVARRTPYQGHYKPPSTTSGVLPLEIA